MLDALRWEVGSKGSNPRAHSDDLDALRGIAILKVFFAHVAGQWWAYTKIPLIVPFVGVDVLDMLRLSPGGVFLFFFLSGYLLTWTEEKRASSGSYSIRSYALRRALRILPAYYLAILVVVVAWPTPASWTDVLTHATFLHTLFPSTTDSLDPVFWSLASEVLFYLMLPFVVLKLPRLWQRLLLLGALILVSQAVRGYVLSGLAPGSAEAIELGVYLNHLPITHLYLFIGGMLLRMLVGRLDGRPEGRLRSVLASTMLLISVSYLLTFPYLGVEVAVALHLPPRLLVDLMMGAFFASALLGGPLVRGVLTWRPLVFVGVISYSLFLLHQTVLIRLSVFLVNDLRAIEPLKAWIEKEGSLMAWATFSLYALATLAVSCAVSYLGYRFVEAPFLRHKPK